MFLCCKRQAGQNVFTTLSTFFFYGQTPPFFQNVPILFDKNTCFQNEHVFRMPRIRSYIKLWCFYYNIPLYILKIDNVSVSARDPFTIQWLVKYTIHTVTGRLFVVVRWSSPQRPVDTLSSSLTWCRVSPLHYICIENTSVP